jgi:hypothetical protein
LGVAAYPTALALLVQRWRPPFDADLLARMQIYCLAGAVAQTLVACWLFRRAEAALTEQAMLWSYAVAWALSEAIGIYGLAVGLWRAEPEVSTLFFTWAIALVLLLRPPAARQDQVSHTAVPSA